jgi:hypothetical protein
MLAFVERSKLKNFLHEEKNLICQACIFSEGAYCCATLTQEVEIPYTEKRVFFRYNA